MKKIMKSIIALLVIILILSLMSTYAQTDILIISKRVVGFKFGIGDLGEYSNEIKINKTTNEIFYRKNTSDKFILISKSKIDSSFLFLKDTLTYSMLDNIVKKKGFDEIQLKFEFIHTDCTDTFFSCRTQINLIEFGATNDQNNEELLKITDIYFKLLYQITK